jgi:hypothetical protein
MNDVDERAVSHLDPGLGDTRDTEIYTDPDLRDKRLVFGSNVFLDSMDPLAEPNIFRRDLLAPTESASLSPSVSKTYQWANHLSVSGRHAPGSATAWSDDPSLQSRMVIDTKKGSSDNQSVITSFTFDTRSSWSFDRVTGLKPPLETAMSLSEEHPETVDEHSELSDDEKAFPGHYSNEEALILRRWINFVEGKGEGESRQV